MELEKKNWILIFATIKISFFSNGYLHLVLAFERNERIRWNSLAKKKKKKKKTSTLFPISNNIWKD